LFLVIYGGHVLIVYFKFKFAFVFIDSNMYELKLLVIVEIFRRGGITAKFKMFKSLFIQFPPPATDNIIIIKRVKTVVQVVFQYLFQFIILTETLAGRSIGIIFIPLLCTQKLR